MGTRHLTIVKLNNEYKVAQYGQWDGYIEGAGLDILNFLKSTNIEQFKKSVNEVSFLTNEALDNLINEINTIIRISKTYDFKEDYPELSRDTGADILTYILSGKTKLLVNQLDFAADSLMCEWAYVIDLDENTFEIFEGFNKEQLNQSERFYFLEEKREENGYHPVKLFKAYSLDNLPDEESFLKREEQE